MLLKLTCPSCGRVEQATERVLGKEVRCPCGTQFRVLQPKAAAPERTATNRGALSRRATAGSVARERASKSTAGFEKLAEAPSARSQAGIPLDVERARAADFGFSPACAAKSGGMPPWAYAVAGGGGVLSLVMMILLFRAVIGDAGPPARTEPAASVALAPVANVPVAAVAADPPGRVAASAAPAEAERRAARRHRLPGPPPCPARCS